MKLSPLFVLVALALTTTFQIQTAEAQFGFAQQPVGFQQQGEPPILKDPAAIERGRQLFQHEFTADDALTPDGDGLGPMSNANSCVACHAQGGVGGAGSVEHNVDLVAVTAPKLQRDDGKALFAEHVSKNVHPGLNQFTPHLVLHAQSTHDGYDLLRLQALGIPIREDMSETQQRRVEAAVKRRRKSQGNLVTYKAAGVAMEWSQRQTPALFGLGAIEEIPRETLKAIEERQEKHPKVSGRLAGRFGWRGQTETLRQFVLGACANELGLQCGDHNQATDPQRPEYQPPGDDLTVDQQEDLIAFVASLPAPEEAAAMSPTLKVTVQQGKNLFKSVGCAVCHVENVGNANGIYSDLLLHDMGPGLADSIPAPPHTVSVEVQTPSFGYFGFSSSSMFTAIPSNTRQEWRTPPLWGVGLSAPYLHDGRAETLEAAILMHGGEAEDSVAAYRRLDGASQRRLIVFLKSLSIVNVPLAVEAPANIQGGFSAF